MSLLLLLSMLSTTGDVLLPTTSPAHLLTTGERTTLGNGITAQWPGIVLADVLTFEAVREKGAVLCSARQNETIDAPTLFTLLLQGIPQSMTLSTTTHGKFLPPEPCVAGMNTAMTTLVPVLDAAATVPRTRMFRCDRNPGGGVDCFITWAKSYSQAAAFTLFQTGATLTPLGVE